MYTTKEGIEEIKSNPQVYTPKEGIEEIKNNTQLYTTYEGMQKTLGIHYLREGRRD